MRIGDLSRRTGVSVASIKYYLREGLLAPGERTSPNQARYDEEHVRRLRLIRALVDVGGLSIAATRDVLATVDADGAALHHVLGATQAALLGAPVVTEDDASARAAKLLGELVRRRGWSVTDKNSGWPAAVEILATSERLGTEVLTGLLDTYAEALEPLATAEVGAVVARGDREDVVESTVLGTVLGAGLISALRTMAHESASSRLGAGPAATPGEG